MNQQQVLHQPFNIDIHKNTFINYLEVVVLEDGAVEYAVPSHQRKLISLACKKLNVSEQELSDLCPEEYYFDFNKWLCQVSGAVALWNTHMEGRANPAQHQTILQLKEHQLYHGPIYLKEEI